MTTARASTDADVEQIVVAHLRAHPDFLENHPELLIELDVPHRAGTAVSLVERQVAAMREHSRAVKQRLKELIAIARENESLNRRVHALSLTLLRAESVAGVVGAVSEGLCRDFRADRVLVRVFPHAAAAPLEPALRGTGEEREEFAEVLSMRKACCGRLNRRRHDLVLGDGSGELGSAVLLPLHGTGWEGLLVIASRDPQRYRPDLGLDLLAYLAEVLSVAIAARVRPRA